MKASPTEIQSALKGAHYPTDLDSLVELAEGNDASEDVLEDLRGLEDREYDSPADVMSAFDADEDEDEEEEEE